MMRMAWSLLAHAILLTAASRATLNVPAEHNTLTTDAQPYKHAKHLGNVPAARRALHVGDQALGACFVDAGVAQPPGALAERLEHQPLLICGDHQYLQINNALTAVVCIPP
jgi:hypothetical protein